MSEIIRHDISLPQGVRTTAEEHQPETEPRATILLAPGAGAPYSSEFMQVFAKGLAARELRVVLFNFGYQFLGRRIPDRLPRLRGEYERTLAWLVERGDSPVFIGGKSLGGRVASHIVADGVEVDGLLMLGYPLHPTGKPETRRDAHLSTIKKPSLFISGTRDALADAELLKSAVEGMGPNARIHWIEDGDHGLSVRKSSGRSTTEAWNEAMDAVRAFVDECA